MANALTLEGLGRLLHLPPRKSPAARKGRHHRSWPKRIWIRLVGRVSRLLYYEARERFYTLKRGVEHERNLMHSTGASKSEPGRWTALNSCKRMLSDNEHLLTRAASDLNGMWRVLTNVHVTLIRNVMGDEKLVEQLDVCREEAHRLRVVNDPTVNRMLLRIAELTSAPNKIGSNRPALIRALVALVQRLNSIRVERILYSHMNLRTYKFALVAVVVVSAGLIANADIVTHGMERMAGIEAPGAPYPTTPEVAVEIGGPAWWAWAVERVDTVRTWIAGKLSENVLAFVFLAGFAGGLFSDVMRVRTGGVEPGEDVYKAYYILTKPLVGAFGALLLFILLGGGLVSSEVVHAVAQPTVKIFGFGILAGFSERIVFPSLQ